MQSEKARVTWYTLREVEKQCARLWEEAEEDEGASWLTPTVRNARQKTDFGDGMV